MPEVPKPPTFAFDPTQRAFWYEEEAQPAASLQGKPVPYVVAYIK